MKKLLLTIAITAIATSSVYAQDFHPAKEAFKPPKKEYSPYAEDHFPNRVYFGDTHLHSSWSTDAGMAGATRGPDVAYRVSRGEEVTSHLGWKVKLIRPLDFLVLADHAENLGLADFIRRADNHCCEKQLRNKSFCCDIKRGAQLLRYANSERYCFASSKRSYASF